MGTCRTKYVFGGIEFSSKKSVQEYASKEILQPYATLQPLNPEHHRFAWDLLQSHPWAEQKIGVGVKRFYVSSVPGYPTRGLWIERIDGTKTDFSIGQCLRPASKTYDFKKACRHAVADQVIRFKRQFFEDNPEPRCPLLGTLLERDNSHVDHVAPDTFEAILCRFVSEFALDVENAVSDEHEDGSTMKHFSDPEVADSWRQYHAANARLRVISAKANLTVARSEWDFLNAASHSAILGGL